MKGNAAIAAPKKLCANNHLIFAWWESCWICAEEVRDEAARDKAAGRDETTIADEEKYGEDEP